MYHSRPTDLVVGGIAVSLENTFELSQEPLRPIAATTQLEIEHHGSPGSAVLPQIGLMIFSSALAGLHIDRGFVRLMHINGGTIALLTGPWQFWTGLRQKSLAVHRWTGRLYILGVGMGIIGAVGLSATTTYGWGFAVGLMGLASAWLVTTSMAYFTIRKGLVALHKEWMIRAYVVTFAFVTSRTLSDYGPTSRL